jgi:acyl-CoA synthetase (AMP-forming)/AMP-acid ligase II/acyl carrier protein
MMIASLIADNDAFATALAAPARAPLTHAALRRAVGDIAARLNQAGIGRTDRLAMALPNGPEMATAFLGVASSAIAAPLNPNFTAAEFDFYFADLNPRALLVEAGHKSHATDAARRRSIPILELTPLRNEAAGLFALTGHAGPPCAADPVTPDDCALLLHTSGTTARPKLVPLTHRKLRISAQNVAAALQLTTADRGLHIMPLFHIHGLVAGLLAPLHTGGSIYCTPGLDMQAFPHWLAEAKPSWLTAVPTMLQSIRDWAQREPQTARQTGLRFIRSCSAALAPSVAAALEEAFGAPVLEAYAMTEAAHQMTSNLLPPGIRKFGSVGIASGPDIAILDSTGNILPPDEAGEVAIRGANVFDGYADNPKANAESFTNGWFRTGDLGALDADGYLWLKGRLKEMINRGGEKLSPIEIENILLTHPAISQAVVFAVPHPSLGEEAGAAIVLREGQQLSPAALRAFILSQLSLPKLPRHIVFVTTLPKGPTGKLRRIGMAETLGLGTAPRPPFVALRSPLERRLADIWCHALAVTDLGADDDFFDLGGNSIAALQIAAEILKAFGVEILISQFLNRPTIAGLALAITEQKLHALPPEALANLLAEAERMPAAAS